MAPLPATLPRTYSRITLRERPRAAVDPKLDGTGTFALEKGVQMWGEGDVKDGQAIVKVEWVSIDPAMRGWLNPTRSYVPPVQIGASMRAAGTGRIVYLPKSAEGGSLRIGDWVVGTLNWTEYAKVPVKELQKIQLDKDISPTYYLGALGMTGQTAYWGLHDVGKIKAGETVVVTGAAGAVGSIACQLAKLHGCRVVAIAGGAEKCAWLRDDLGIETVLDYKSPNFKKDFRGIGYVDVCFENVGGEILDLVLSRLNKNARIALCGAIAAYNSSSPQGLQMYLNLISQRASIAGFIVFDYADRYDVAAEEMARHIRAGKLKIRETHLHGLDECVNGLTGLFEGKNTGKMLVRIGEEGAKL
ncbi:hypothetical protein JCM10450v2_006647 [Rhodotorula kratochvilovae]